MGVGIPLIDWPLAFFGLEITDTQCLDTLDTTEGRREWVNSDIADDMHSELEMLGLAQPGEASGSIQEEMDMRSDIWLSNQHAWIGRCLTENPRRRNESDADQNWREHMTAKLAFIEGEVKRRNRIKGLFPERRPWWSRLLNRHEW